MRRVGEKCTYNPTTFRTRGGWGHKNACLRQKSPIIKNNAFLKMEQVSVTYRYVIFVRDCRRVWSRFFGESIYIFQGASSTISKLSVKFLNFCFRDEEKKMAIHCIGQCSLIDSSKISSTGAIKVTYPEYGVVSGVILGTFGKSVIPIFYATLSPVPYRICFIPVGITGTNDLYQRCRSRSEPGFLAGADAGFSTRLRIKDIPVYRGVHRGGGAWGVRPPPLGSSRLPPNRVLATVQYR